MSNHDHAAENNPLREFKFALVFLAMFVALFLLIFLSGYFRPVAPKSIAETNAIIGVEAAKPAAATATASPAVATATPATPATPASK